MALELYRLRYSTKYFSTESDPPSGQNECHPIPFNVIYHVLNLTMKSTSIEVKIDDLSRKVMASILNYSDHQYVSVMVEFHASHSREVCRR